MNTGSGVRLGSRSGTSSGTPLIEMRGVSKRFRKGSDTILALDNIDVAVHPGEFVCIVGPSGCGKSTLLNMTAGLMQPSQGSLLYGGGELSGPNTDVGYITQSDNLMPWRTVGQNIGLGLEIRGVNRNTRLARVKEMVDLVGLEGFEDAYPPQLSGGMRKRAALARILAYEPETILADEPFGALDAQLKLLMQDELQRIWQSVSGRTVIFITHDLAEAITLGDRVIVLSRRPGRIRIDCAIDIERPRNVMSVRFTERFGELHQLLWETLAEDVAAGEDGL